MVLASGLMDMFILHIFESVDSIWLNHQNMVLYSGGV